MPARSSQRNFPPSRQDFHDIARIAEHYGDGTVRLTCEENLLFVNVPEAKLEAMRAEPMFQRFKLDAGTLTRGMVTCTGSQFCGFGLAETKNKAISVRPERAPSDPVIPFPPRTGPSSLT